MRAIALDIVHAKGRAVSFRLLEKLDNFVAFIAHAACIFGADSTEPERDELN